ncbi:putative phage protein Rha [Escherichia coli]|nr:putative phage protein Rha [Escherichia coli]
MAELIQQGLANLEAERNAVMLEYMKEKDVASYVRSFAQSLGQGEEASVAGKAGQAGAAGADCVTRI